MSIIWWTLYILGAISIVLLWVQLMALIGTACKVIRDKEWAQVKAVMREQGILSRKDIESLIRMEVAAYLSKLDISRTTYPSLNREETKIQMKEDK